MNGYMSSPTSEARCQAFFLRGVKTLGNLAAYHRRLAQYQRQRREWKERNTPILDKGKTKQRIVKEAMEEPLRSVEEITGRDVGVVHGD